MMKRQIWLALVALVWAAEASAQLVVDGIADATYGTALSVQNTNTQFGNAILGDPINGGGGSEIDQVFGRIENGRLYVMIAGNLERNFNKLEVFVDSKAGAGVNTIDGASLPAAVDAFCCGGFGTTDGALQRMTGLTFDAGFDADYYLTFSNGFESVGPEVSPGQRETQYWAISGHYAELGDGTAGTVVAAGVQYAHRGLPNVLRFPGDYNDNGSVDAADYTVFRDTLGASVARGSGADANGDLTITDADYNIWKTRFGSDTSLAGFPFKPDNLADGVSEALLGPNLPGLAQGQLVDSTYALGANGGCNADNSGAGCVAKELEFVLPIDAADPNNAENHRNFTNSVDLQLGFDNSNTVGVSGAGPYTDPTTENPQDVTSGLEFSIPLSQIGNPTGDVKLTIFVNGTGHDFGANQFAGEGILFGNVGNLWPNLEVEFLGNQFVTVQQPILVGAGGVAGVPEPTSALLAFVSLIVGGAMVRRRA
ncbi:MAG: dockerin type I domain-containing protein [Pirellulales bacterium]